jgi:ABC-type antimicrobial peptide transport system permease subunit
LNLAWVPQITGNYFQAQGISIIRGRGFTATDDLPGAPLVAIVNRALAEKYWPGQDPIGKRLHRGPAQATKLPWETVVGEIGDVKQLAADQPTGLQIYVPASQVKASAGSFVTATFVTANRGSIVVRGQVPPEQMAGSLRAIVHSLDPQLPLTDVESMDRVVGEGQASRRFMMVLISAFAGGALLLALLGIYSVIAFSAAMRAHEMAIRIALGAQRSSVMRLVLGSAAKLGLVGSGIGVIAAVFATRLLRSMLFEVDPVDPVVIGVAAVVIMLLTLAASVAPARRVAGVEPVEALRSE